MFKLIPALFRWVSKSTPALAVVLVAAGATGAYALGATGGGDTTTKTDDGPRTSMAFGVAEDQNLSEADRKSLEAFGTCMKDSMPQPGDGTQPPDPAEGKAKMDAAFDECKSELTDSLQTKFEQQEAQRQEYETCLEENGAPKPSAGEAPSESDIQAMEKARKACEDKLPDEAGMALCVGGPGGPGGPGRHGGPGGPPGAFGMALPAPPSSGSSNESGTSSNGSGSSS